MPRRSGSSRSRTARARPIPRTSRRWGRRSRRSSSTATPTAATDRSTSRSRPFPSTASWRGSITPASRAARASTPTSTTRKTRATSSLWKATKPGEPTWDPGIGPGRPGWHIECSAMALRLLGEPPIDIHAGGVDLIFPHHENEIAQSEGATGTPFSRFWMHVEHLMIEESSGKTDKMSKSLGNVYNLEDIVDQGFRPSALRYLYLGIALPQAAEVLVGGDGAGGGGAQAPDRFPRAARRRCRRVPAHAGDDRRAARARRSEAFAEHIARRPQHRRRRSASCSISCARSTRRSTPASSAPATPRRSATTFERFDRVLGILSLRRAEDERPPVPVEEIEQLIARAARRPAGAQLRRSRSHPQGPRRARHPPRRHRRETRWKRRTREQSDPEMRRPRHQDAAAGPQGQGHHRARRKFVSPSYTRDYPFVIARGEGAVVEDVDGNRSSTAPPASP